MMWDDYDHPMRQGITWGTGVLMVLVVLLFLAALAVLVFAVLQGTSAGAAHRGAGDRGTRPRDDHLTGAEQVLAERFARGELDEDEFRHRRDVLRRT